LGVFDMLGNLAEWCHDNYRGYPSFAPGAAAICGDTVTIVDDRASMVTRGMVFNHFPTGRRSASRMNAAPWTRALVYGIRVARTLP
jgi:formylglycine-generating enzyme required for sulfatase activity